MRKNDLITYKMSKEETIKYLRNALIVYPGLRAMIEERNVKVERMARAKYALFEHDKLEEMEQFENVDEYVLSEMKKDKELNELKYQFKMISSFMQDLTKTNAHKLLSYIRLKYFFDMPRRDIINQLHLTEKTYDIKEVKNETTLVEVSKTDITGDKELEGAKLSVIDENNKVIDEWTSTARTHKIEGLKVGKTYTLREDLAPIGYAKSTDIKFKVENTGKVQKVTMIDKVVEISKTDITTGEELEGAELTVTDENGKVIDSWTSTKEAHKVTGLEEGKKYTLTETTCPYGYKQAESITFEVSKDKETQKIEMKDAPILKNVKVQKVDSETKEVIKEKFVFGIYKDAECKELIQEVKSNKDDGFVEFKDLRYGTYYVKEVSAPKGYELSDRIAKVEINDKGIFVDDTQITETEDTITFDFENKKIEVPKTGDNSAVRLALGVMLLAFLGIAWVVIKIFKKKDNK